MAERKIVSSGNELLNADALLRQQLHLQPGHMIADLGCGGSGFFSLAAARIVGDQGQVYAVDILKSALHSVETKARMEGLYNIKTVWSNLEIYGATEIPEQSLDHGLLVNILFQSKKHAEILHEAARLLKVGGRLTIIDWEDLGAPFAPAPEDSVKLDVVRNVMTDLNFSEESQFPAGQYHFGIIFIKSAS